MKKSQIIAVANHKGGVGKTATVATVGAILASQGKNVLIVDLDTQANLTRHFLENVPDRIVYHAIKERRNLPVLEIREHLCLVPSGLDMAGIEIDMTSMRKREEVIKGLLAPYRGTFSYILLDCPPSLGLVTLNALTAADHLLVPMKADLMSFYGLNMMDRFCKGMQDLNEGIKVDMIFFNIYEKGQKVTDAIEKEVREAFRDRVLSTVVRKNNDISKAAFQLTDVVSAFPDANGAKDFLALADEIERRLLMKNI